MNTMTLPATTSTITIAHEGVYVTASGRIKIAATPGKKWRMWIYDETTNTWQLQREVWLRTEFAKAAAAAELVEKGL